MSKLGSKPLVTFSVKTDNGDSVHLGSHEKSEVQRWVTAVNR
jgi:hypothetical protein